MKRSILAGLSLVLLSSATATVVKAESSFGQIKPTTAGPTAFLNQSEVSQASTLLKQIKPTVAGPTVFESQSTAVISGTFVAAEKPTTGTAKIVTENGQRYLVLDSAFSTSEQGPDLHVLLDTAQKPPQQYQNSSSYVNLGKLQKYQGMQRYPIPAGINLANYKSVVIWCQMANATFGYASLGSPAMTAQR
ncbi:MAG TPA: DM13 domain-containing protein [Chroococcales cyanobacterium]|jgi:hypothetical protein